MSDQRLTHAGRVHMHAATDPGIHLDESLRRDLLDVNRIGAVENSQVTGQAGLFHEPAHDGQRHLAHVQTAQRSPA